MTQFAHVPVMPREVIEGLAIKPDGIYLDCTLGGGGHSELILKKLTTGRLIAIDKDEEALAFANKDSQSTRTKSRSYTAISRERTKFSTN